MSPPGKATLQTVADVVGVSRSTVSNAYGRPDQLSPDLRGRILETARQLGYPGPHPTARSLRRGRAGAVGVLFMASLSDAFTDPYAVQFLSGLASVAERHGSGLLLVPVRSEDPETATQLVLSSMVDGFCVYCVPKRHPVLDALGSRNLPVVDTEHVRLGVDGGMCVAIDEEAGAYGIAAHLTALGHRRLSIVADWAAPDRVTRFVTVPDLDAVPSDVARDRMRGYRRAFAEVGVDWPDITILSVATNNRLEGTVAGRLLLARRPRPTAVLATSDVLALGVLDAMRESGLRPGRDVSVGGFDGIADAAEAGLTTVAQPGNARGRAAGDLLFDPPADREAGRLVLPTELVVRSSTGPVTTRRK
jgi:DNA-binding LacI/PurR family transcriptional regulator